MTKVDGLDCVIRHHGAGIVNPRELREEIEASLNKDPGGPALDYLLRMLARTSIWLPVGLHVSMPVLLPHVLRDNDCRK